MKLSRGQQEELEELRWLSRREPTPEERRNVENVRDSRGWFRDPFRPLPDYDDVSIAQYFAYTSTGVAPTSPTDGYLKLRNAQHNRDILIATVHESAADVEGGWGFVVYEYYMDRCPATLILKLRAASNAAYWERRSQ